MKRFWVAHVRAQNFDRLRREGFVVLYPHVDDYVFLEATIENKKKVRKALSYGIKFLRSGPRLQAVTEADIEKMRVQTTNRLVEGAPVKVVEGIAANMTGKVLSICGDKALCRLQGYQRQYEQEIALRHLVPLPGHENGRH